LAVPSGRTPNVAPGEPVDDLVNGAVAPGGNNQLIARGGGELGGMIRVLGIQDPDLEPAIAQDFGEALQITLVACTARVRIAYYD
jgi:hypothetical protein